MKATELRIGNYVKKHDGSIDTIKEIWEREVMYSNGMVDDEPDPIPLTEQWLLDFGFVKHGKHVHFIKEIRKYKEFILMFDDRDNSWFLCDTDVDTTIKHVHQLQNLYFALTGIELIKK